LAETGDVLPIDAVLPDLVGALRREGLVVLTAPPGAGKTTRVPLALLPEVSGRIVVLEPRRLAARAAAERMAATLGEAAGRTVGWRIRGEARVSAETRIEVVTEGILTRMIQSDPDLPGVSAVIFDEFHERSLVADLGLALAWEVRGALRPDLWIVVMSATLDAGPVSAMLGGAPQVVAEGRAFPVETRWLDRPLAPGRRWEQAMADLVADAVQASDGGVLAFCPGEREIRRVAAALDGRLPAGCRIRPLFGAMPFAEQRAAVAPDPDVRKVVLATAIAETSLTIADIRVVVDGGRARRARFDPGSGMTRLVTERVTRAEAEQRRGRAGRVAPGICWRLWSRGEEGALGAFPPPEIAAGDVTGLALDLALWGAGTTDGMAFLDAPNPGAWAEARALLADLAALDPQGRITGHGRAMAAMPLHPRLAHMLATAGRQAAPLAALLSDRDPLRGAPVDLALRAKLLADPVAFARAHPWQVDRTAVDRLRAEAARLARGLSDGPERSLAEQAALAYPDRIALRRKGDDARWLLSGGKGAKMEASDPLAGERLLVVTDTDGDLREVRIRQAVAIAESDLRAALGERIAWEESCAWDARAGRVRARRQERLGALVLSERRWETAPGDALARAMCDGVRDLGLVWSASAERLRARVTLLRSAGEDLPDLSDAALVATLDAWLLPWLDGITTAAAFRALDLFGPLRAHLGNGVLATIDRLAPATYATPLGRAVPIDYSDGTPSVEVRLQEMFGTVRHPTTAGQAIRFTLLSPAGLPIQVTRDIPGFWDTSYAEVRKDMRGRYPRHPWPEDPRVADPTLRAKPRGKLLRLPRDPMR
jgi:ATP-dependent helicase HrpB